MRKAPSKVGVVTLKGDFKGQPITITLPSALETNPEDVMVLLNNEDKIVPWSDVIILGGCVGNDG